MSKKKYPARVRFFVADDIRSDGPKPMIFGLFSDDSVSIQMAPEAPEPTREKPVVLQGLAILVSFIDCRGPFIVETSLYQPDGSALFEKQKLEDVVDTPKGADKNVFNFIAKFMPFVVPLFGKYRFVIQLDKKEFSYEFAIVRHALPADS